MGNPQYLHDGDNESPVDNKLAEGSRSLIAARRAKKWHHFSAPCFLAWAARYHSQVTCGVTCIYCMRTRLWQPGPIPMSLVEL